MVFNTLQDVIGMTTFTRATDFNDIYDKLSVDLITSFVNYRSFNNSSFIDIKNNSYKKSKLLHNLLKYPIAPALQSNYQTTKGSGKITITSGNNVVIGSFSKFTTEITEINLLSAAQGANWR